MLGRRPFPVIDAINRRDWAAIERQFAADAVLEDHRRARFGTVAGRETITALYRSLAALSPDVRVRTNHALTDGTIHLTFEASVGTVDDAPFENRAIIVSTNDATDRVRRVDWYDEA